jgi:hypothetical protein
VRALSFALLALGLGACSDVLYLQGSVDQLCQRLPAQSFRAPPLPATLKDVSTPAVTIERRFDFDVTAQLPPELAAAKLTIGFDRLTLTAKGPVDLRMVQAAKLTLESPPSQARAPKVVLQVAEASPAALQFVGEDLELSPYLAAGVLSYTVALTAVPAEVRRMGDELTADVDACANVSVRWDYAR